MTNGTDQEKKEEFSLHVEHITDTHKAFIENTAKVAGFLLLALGWFVTSKEARAFLTSSPIISVLSATAVAAAYLLSVAASSVAYQVSCRADSRLRQLSYLPESAYKGRLLGRTTFFVCVAGNGVLSLLLIVALLTAK